MAEFIREATPPVGCSSRNSYAGLDPSNQVRTCAVLFCFFPSSRWWSQMFSGLLQSVDVWVYLADNFLICLLIIVYYYYTEFSH